MSVIVAVTTSRTVLAADSQTSFGDSQRIPSVNCRTRKVRRVGDALLGAAGWGVYDYIFDNFLEEGPEPDLTDDRAIFAFFLDLWKALHEKYPFVNDQSQGKDSPFGDLDSSFLIASRTGIYKVSHDLDVCSFDQYYAIGSGAEYAMGALHALYDGGGDPVALARAAVEAAIQFDVHCGGDPDVLELPGV